MENNHPAWDRYEELVRQLRGRSIAGAPPEELNDLKRQINAAVEELVEEGVLPEEDAWSVEAGGPEVGAQYSRPDWR